MKYYLLKKNTTDKGIPIKINSRIEPKTYPKEMVSFDENRYIYNQ